MKVIIAGSRSFSDYELMERNCDHMLQNQTDIEVVSGTADGADKLGEVYASNIGHRIKRFPADWKTYGRKAGFLRNEKMAKYADALIAFWDGSSKGTEHMINLAKKHNLKIKVVTF